MKFQALRTNDLNSYKLVPNNLPNYILAIGSEGEMVRCKQVTVFLSNEYIKDERIENLKERLEKLYGALRPGDDYIVRGMSLRGA